MPDPCESHPVHRKRETNALRAYLLVGSLSAADPAPEHRRTVMQPAPVDQPPAQSTTHWLKAYYFTRAAFSVIWVALAVTIARNVPQLAAALLVAYPAWDAIANYSDAKKSG